MKIILFGNGAISKTFQAIHEFKKEILVIDRDSRSKPDIVCDINNKDEIKNFIDENDILVDLTNDQNTFLTADWCYQNNINYINADIGSVNNLSSKEKYDIFLEKKKELKEGKTIF